MGLIQVGILSIVVIVIVCDQVLEGSLLNKHRDVIEELIMAGTNLVLPRGPSKSDNLLNFLGEK